MNNLTGQFLRWAGPSPPPDCRVGRRPATVPYPLRHLGLAVAAVTAKIQAMGRRGDQLPGWTADINHPRAEKEDAEQGKRRRRGRETGRREKEREERAARTRVSESRDLARSRDASPRPPQLLQRPLPAPAASCPHSGPLPWPPWRLPISIGPDPDLAALEQAKQVELRRSLAESGSESVTLSQQENTDQGAVCPGTSSCRNS